MKNKYFQMAKRLSLHSTHAQHKLGCVIVKKNRIISCGFNENKTHTKSTHKYHFLHAEISALIGLTYEKTKGSVAYVYREQKNGRTGLSRPCRACEMALRLSGVKRVYYTTYGGWDSIEINA